MIKPISGKESTARLVRDGNALETRIVGASTLAALSPERLRILTDLAKEPQYPAEVARSLDLQVQTVYYHIRLLAQAGLIELERYEAQGGALAKKYRATSEALAVTLQPKWKPFSTAKWGKPPAYLDPFVSSQAFQGRIVVGSPDPHGKFRARGSELCAMELSMMLGRYASFEYPLYYLDTEMNEKSRRDPLIVIGGPKVNMTLAELNPHLPIRFDERTLELHSTVSGRKYAENFGVIELIDNPWNRNAKILALAGSDHTSTRVAVLALLKERSKLEEGNTADRSVMAKVVQGFDEDGDGIVDAVEILE